MKKEVLKELTAKPGKEHHVSDFNPSFTADMSKQDAKEQLVQNIEKLSELQSMLYAQDRYSVLVIFQAMDAAGKDGTIKHVMSVSIRKGVRCTPLSNPLPKNWIMTTYGESIVRSPNGDESESSTVPNMKMY